MPPAEAIPAVTPIWDALATQAIEALWYLSTHEVRVRWRWPHLFHWCCRRPMRWGCFEYRPLVGDRRWAIHTRQFVVCPTCRSLRRIS